MPYVTQGILGQIAEISEYQKIQSADMIPTVINVSDETIEPITAPVDSYISDYIRKETRIIIQEMPVPVKIVES